MYDIIKLCSNNMYLLNDLSRNLFLVAQWVSACIQPVMSC